MPSSPLLDRQAVSARSHALAENAQWVRQWIKGKHEQRTSHELSFVGLDGTHVSVPVHKCRVSFSDLANQRATNPYGNDHVGCWYVPAPNLPTSGYFGARSAWDSRSPSTALPPRAVIWVMGDALHVAAIDSIEDTIVIGPGEDPRQTVEHLRRVGIDVFGHGTQHILVRTHSRYPSVRAVEREVEFGRALVNELETSTAKPVRCTWLPTDAPLRPEELGQLAETVSEIVDIVVVGVHAALFGEPGYDCAFQDAAGW